MNRPYLTLTFICLGWMVSLTTFQWFAEARLVDLVRPDYAVSWSQYETQRRGGSVENDYLRDPFMNRHVAWDSEFYLSVAIAGYDDPEVRTVQTGDARITTRGIFSFYERYDDMDDVSLNYAFFPLYGWLMKGLSVPLGIFGMNDIATATLAGVIISALGTLLGMFALYDITREELEERGAVRTAFYLLIFPSSMFLAQVYTEGLFVGLSFGAIALMRRQQWVLAAVLSALATWTRAVGVMLFVPFLFQWIIDTQWSFSTVKRPKLIFLLTFVPIVTHLAWRFSRFGFGSQVVQRAFFQRGFLKLSESNVVWGQAFGNMFAENTQTTAYYLLEFGTMAVALWACIALIRRYPAIALYSAAVILTAYTSGVAQGMHRYVLAAPALFIWLGERGKNPIFDRIYTILGILLMAMVALTFTFDFWTG